MLVNNAGGQFPQAAIDFSPKGFNAVIDTNLNGTWYMMQQAARRWRDAGRGGRIVNIVAVTTRGMPGVAHTAAARAGVVALSKTVAIEWAPLGIQINCVAPGIIATEGMNVYSEAAREALPKTNLLRRFGDVRDVADAVCYLAGPSGSFITGTVVTVDGGNRDLGRPVDHSAAGLVQCRQLIKSRASPRINSPPMISRRISDVPAPISRSLLAR